MRGAGALYEVVRGDLERRITSGEIEVGDWLPSEAALQQSYGVSRTPVRHALRDLETLGLIRRSQGRGSLVTSARISAGLRVMISFSEELRRQGRRVEATTLAIRHGPEPEAAAELSLPEDARFTTVRRLFVVDGSPLALFTHHLGPVVPYDAVESAGDFSSLYALLRKLHLPPYQATETIAAELLDEDQAHLLGVRRPAAAQLRKRLSWTEWGDPLEHTVYHVRADRYETRIELRQM